jgi:hypothetical protein
LKTSHQAKFRQILIAVTALALLGFTPSPLSAEEVNHSPSSDSLSSDEVEWVQRVIPSYTPGKPLEKKAKTIFGKNILPRHSQRTQWYPREVERSPSDTQEAQLIIIWLYPENVTQGPIYFPRSGSVVFGITALLKEDEVLSIGNNLIARDSDQVITIVDPLSFPSLNLWRIEETTRKKGLITRIHTFFRKTKKELRNAGSIPIQSSNVGVCGDFERARTKKRGLGGKERCKKIWHFEAKISKTGKKVVSNEILIEAKARRYKTRTRKKRLHYKLLKGRLKASKKSLRSEIPLTQ